MTAGQIRLGVMASGLIAVSVLVNLLLLQPNDGRPRSDLNYRGLSHLPGTHSNSLDDLETSSVKSGDPIASISVATTTDTQPGKTSAQSEAELVADIQTELAKRGYVLGNTAGKLDSVTRAAIMAFEHDRGLMVTARPSVGLRDALRGGPVENASTTSAPTAESAEIVRTVQRSLSLLNYRPGAVDGVMGQATSAAIRAFERDHKIPESGRISGLLVAEFTRLGVFENVAAR
ncbi:MAG: peptidoglycan-binding protein [Hyphomicrobiaceae bacterium]|nr:peptidoglycan-binding protein [Hyphomicrobiaceae bacterium]